jgi:hypothetical protein
MRVRLRHMHRVGTPIKVLALQHWVLGDDIIWFTNARVEKMKGNARGDGSGSAHWLGDKYVGCGYYLIWYSLRQHVGSVHSYLICALPTPCLCGINMC